MNVRFVLFLSFLFIGKALTAQQRDITAVLQAITSKISTEFPIADSSWLAKTHPLNFTRDLRSKLNITGKDARELNTRKKEFYIVKDSLFPGVAGIPGKRFESITNTDSSNNLFVEYGPWYHISTPLFFHDNVKALILVSLRKVNLMAYIVENENGRWVIKKEALLWGNPYP